ncbi:MAG: prepilin-type N-terminal cleavage/methylation domain-containing protein [Candidatus Gottesmanbacteria bacterium]
MKNNGFTFIELIIAIVIVSILSSFGYAKYTDFNKRQILKSSALNLITHIRQAQEKAMAVEKPSLNCQKLVGYEVYFSNVTTYSIRAQCDNGGGGTFPVVVGGLSLKSPVRVNNPGDFAGDSFNLNRVAFKIFGQGVRTPRTFCLRYGNTGTQYYKIQVTRSGEIIDGGAVSVCP